MFGGPLGAVLGAALGHQLIDKQQTARRQLFQQSGTLLDNVARNQAAYFVCMLSMLAKLAKADGAVTQAELAVVERLINGLPVSSEEKAFARRVFNEAKSSPYSLEDSLEDFAA